MPYSDDTLVPGLQQDIGSRSQSPSRPRMSHDSLSSVSTTSLVFERIEERLAGSKTSDFNRNHGSDDDDHTFKEESQTDDLETGAFLGGGNVSHTDADLPHGGKSMDRRMRKVLLISTAALISAWLIGLFVYITTQSYKPSSTFEHDPQATVTRGSGKKVTLDQVQSGYWYPTRHSISWIAGPEGEDGLLLLKDAAGMDFLVVQDVRDYDKKSTSGSVPDAAQVLSTRTLIKSNTFDYDGRTFWPSVVVPSNDLKKVLISTNRQSNWRHSSYSVYWIFDVETQTAEPLIPNEPDTRIQLAQWSPTSDAVAFTRDNNLFLRKVGDNKIIPITTDGSPEVFNGVPDWVYEEEVFSGDSATWWSEDGKTIAFLRTNETGVPEYPIQYFVSRPSGIDALAGEESYPEVRMIKYPKAGAHNPVVNLKFYDVERGDVFSVETSGSFEDEDRLITEVVWAGEKVLIKETNRVSDIMRVVLVDVKERTGKAVRTTDVKAIDGGWFEISQKTKYIPADASKGREHDGYVDTIIYEDRDHLAYFAPLDNPEPVMLTSGDWEVIDAPSGVSLEKNTVYFVATKESSIQRHVYQVSLPKTGSGAVKSTANTIKPVTDTTAEGYYGVSFSTHASYGLLTYHGPGIPWQKIISTEGTEAYEHIVETNQELSDKAKKHALPLKVYGTINVDGVELNYVERRPPHFDPKKTYPVLFHQYSGPGSQSVNKRFGVDFQSYIAAGLGYVCVTVDGRGTGFIGRKNRVIVRENLGYWESHDQIAAAKIWAKKKYVDASRLAIWGWSYGGFMTLKTLEQDAGQTFSYGMAVAPVTDWRFYDSIYTERYMLTPQTNNLGYMNSTISNVTALSQNVRFLLMHGVADDNVHMQNSLTLLDKLDLAGVENYDVHVFPDSDHGISFHNANRIVYDKLTNWVINAFNGEWIKVNNAKPKPEAIPVITE